MWQCKKCSKKGDFELLGKGLIKCKGCGALHFVPTIGELILLTSKSLENRRKNG